MVYCSKCGKKNEDDAEFCGKCGDSLKTTKQDYEKEWEKRCEDECSYGEIECVGPLLYNPCIEKECWIWGEMTEVPSEYECINNELIIPERPVIVWRHHVHQQVESSSSHRLE